MSVKLSIEEKLAALGSGPRSKNLVGMYANPAAPTSVDPNIPANEPTNTNPDVHSQEPTNIPTNEPANVQTNEPTNIPVNVSTNEDLNIPTNVRTHERTNTRTKKHTVIRMNAGEYTMREILSNNNGVISSTTIRMPKQMHIELGVYKSRSQRTGDDIITEAIALYMDLLGNQKFKKRLEASGGDVYDAVMEAVNK